MVIFTHEEFQETKLSTSHTHTHAIKLIFRVSQIRFRAHLLLLSLDSFLMAQFSCKVNPLTDPQETFRYGDVAVKTNAGMLEFESRMDFQKVMEDIIAKNHAVESGTNMTFEADEKDDSEVRHGRGSTMPWDEAIWTLVE